MLKCALGASDFPGFFSASLICRCVICKALFFSLALPRGSPLRRALAKGGVCVRHCRTAFMKHVFPRFCSPKPWATVANITSACRHGFSEPHSKQTTGQTFAMDAPQLSQIFLTVTKPVTTHSTLQANCGLTALVIDFQLSRMSFCFHNSVFFSVPFLVTGAKGSCRRPTAGMTPSCSSQDRVPLATFPGYLFQISHKVNSRMQYKVVSTLQQPFSCQGTPSPL